MILVVHDEPGVLFAFKTALLRMSVPYRTAATLAEAANLIPHHRWWAFIFDLELPDGLGVALLESVRRVPNMRHIPAAVITANILLIDDLERRITAAGATLHCGIFARPDIEAMCSGLLRMSGVRMAH